jgi:hypothetical protein
MVPITFSLLAVAACAFLIYVFAQFRRELLNCPVGGPNLTEVDVRRTEAALMFERLSSHADGTHWTKTEAVMRKEMLTIAIIGLVGLLAPFIFVMLLNSPWRH